MDKTDNGILLIEGGTEGIQDNTTPRKTHTPILHNTYWILSLPRSRSSWMSVLFNQYPTPAFRCYHEYWSYHPTLRSSTPDLYNSACPTPHTGFCETNPWGVPWERIPRNAPILVIDRPLPEIMRSLVIRFGFKTVAQEDDGTWTETARLLIEAKNHLTKRIADYTNVETVRFSEIGRAHTIQRVWNHLMPSHTLHGEQRAHWFDRLSVLNGFQIQPVDSQGGSIRYYIDAVNASIRESKMEG